MYVKIAMVVLGQTCGEVGAGRGELSYKMK